MKRTINFKPLLASLVAMLVSVNVNAHDAVIDGIYYNLVGNMKQATVTYTDGSSSYYNDITIPSTIVYEGVTYNVASIGDYAFSSCSQLTSVTIPSSVTSIGDNAFSSCSRLTSVTIPSSVTSIGDNAFSSCSQLTSVTIPSSVTSIGDYAFSSCSQLTSVTIPSSVTSIGTGAFQVCSGLTSVTINGVTSIGNSSFYNCSGLTTVTIRNGVTSIGNSSFYGCTNLNDLTIPGSVKTIGTDAFNGCTGLTSIVISEGVTSIASRAFYNCSNLTSIIIPSSMTRINSVAFVGCTSLPIINGIRYADTYAIETIDKELMSYSLKEGTRFIGDDCFKSCTGIFSFDLPSTLIDIGNNAFENCTGLSSISFPEGLTSIGFSAFQGCTGLSSISFPEGLTSIGSSAFQGCTGLSSISFPEGLTSIGVSAFEGCTGLSSISFPEGLTSIESSAFKGCTGLTSVTIPSSVTSIGNYAFSSCSRLTSVTIPSSVTSIGNYAFSSCSRLTSVTIPSSVTSIGTGAFNNCSGLTSVTIPSSVTSIGTGAFNNCSGLTSVTMDCNTQSAPFAGITSLNEVTIGNNVTMVYNGSFSGCTNLEKVTLGTNVQYIRTDAFKGCTQLNSITCNATEPPLVYPNVFADIDVANCTLNVPQNALEAYAANSPWNSFVQKVNSVELACKELTLEMRQMSTLAVTVLPINAVDKTLTWTSSDESVATVDANGKVTAIEEGEALIIATATDGSGKADTCRLTVTQICTLIADYGDRIDTLYSRGMLPKIELSDIVQSVRSLIDCSAETLTYSRTYKSTSWQAWYVPFDLTLTNDVLDDFSFAKFAGTYTEDDGTFYISITRMNEGDVVKANTPYLVQAKVADSENPQVITLTNATLYASRETGFSMYSAEKKVTVQGVYSRKEVTEEDRGWYALSGGKYSQQNKLGNALSSFRFYLTITDREDNPYASSPNPAEVKIRVLGEDADGVTPLSVSPEEEKPAVYDLSGRRIAEDKATKGIYIINGKKVFVR